MQSTFQRWSYDEGNINKKETSSLLVCHLAHTHAQNHLFQPNHFGWVSFYFRLFYRHLSQRQNCLWTNRQSDERTTGRTHIHTHMHTSKRGLLLCGAACINTFIRLRLIGTALVDVRWLARAIHVWLCKCAGKSSGIWFLFTRKEKKKKARVP